MYAMSFYFHLTIGQTNNCKDPYFEYTTTAVATPHCQFFEVSKNAIYQKIEL